MPLKPQTHVLLASMDHLAGGLLKASGTNLKRLICKQQWGALVVVIYSQTFPTRK